MIDALRFFRPILTAEVQYGIRIRGYHVLMDGNPMNRADQEARLARHIKLWPDAELVERNVYYGEWKETQ